MKTGHNESGDAIRLMIADTERKIESLGREAARADLDGKVEMALDLNRKQADAIATLAETRRMLQNAGIPVRNANRDMLERSRLQAQNVRRRLDDLRHTEEDLRRLDQLRGLEEKPGKFRPDPRLPLPEWMTDPATVRVGIVLAIDLFLICALLVAFRH